MSGQNDYQWLRFMCNGCQVLIKKSNDMLAAYKIRSSEGNMQIYFDKFQRQGLLMFRKLDACFF